jgi:Cu/Ag efflux pump CusA
VNVSDVLNLIETAIGGKVAGQIFEGEKRFNLVVADLKQRLDKEVKLPPGYYLEFGGQFKNLQDARIRRSGDSGHNVPNFAGQAVERTQVFAENLHR